MMLLLLLGGTLLAAGPPFEDRPADGHIVDTAAVFNRVPEEGVEEGLRAFLESRGVDVVVYTQVKAASKNQAAANADAQALLEQWDVGGRTGQGAALLFDFDRQTSRALVSLAVSDGLAAVIDAEAVRAQVAASMTDALDTDDWVNALNRGVFTITGALPATTGRPTPTVPPASVAPEATDAPRPTPRPTPGPLVPDLGAAPAGPPYPAPITGLRVYDYAAVLSPETRLRAAATIAAIEARTGAQVVVYTQVKPSSDTAERAEADARSLIDQYGVGREGFDDGLAILFDLDDTRCHGQVQLYAAPGFQSSYLTNADRQAIYQDDMVPRLRACDMDGALDAALRQIDAATTPERANQLQLARQVDAATGLVLAPLVLMGLIAWAGWSWLRFGRDPEYIDDPSVLMPAPPPGLTPAAAAVVLDGRVNRHALTTAFIDLAGRGEVRFRQPADGGRTTIDLFLEPDRNDPRVLRNRSVPLGEPEALVRSRLRGIRGAAGSLDADDLIAFTPAITEFDRLLGSVVVASGWYREDPERSTERWSFRAGLVLVLGVIGAIVAWNLPSSGLLLLSGALIAASIAMFVLARVMPQRTMSGAMVYAWLAAYRRTLEHTLAGVRSMDEVVASHVLPWVETPDQAVVWGYALGLHHEVEDVLERSIETAREATSTGLRTPYLPIWYVAASSGPGSSGLGASFSSSAVPDFGSMTAALSTIGSSAASSSSSSGGGGGFGGSGSGGGGGGAGGGF